MSISEVCQEVKGSALGMYTSSLGFDRSLTDLQYC